MRSATLTIEAGPIVTAAELGWKYVSWGLGLFIAGFVTGFVPILHYMTGAVTGNVSAEFLKNITLWWGCPAILAELTLKTGSLGMIGIGLAYLAAVRQGASTVVSRREQLAVVLCGYGLIAELVTASVGFVVCNMIWPSFYYHAVPAGKNTWLAMQGVSIAVYVIGLWHGVAGVRRASREQRR
ncbi:hypothetical protein ACIPRI_03780 [Variovorax sp. LARHSF232]